MSEATESTNAPNTHDPELEVLIQRGLALRLTMKEMATAAGTTDVQLWRWRHSARPNWDKRNRAMAGLAELIEAIKAEYAEV